jgi:hypothetical protein
LAHDPTAAAEIIAESMAAYAAKGAAGSNP